MQWSVSQLLKYDPEMARILPDTGAIIGFRNILVHAYYRIEHPLVWRAMVEDVPVLTDLVRELLAQGDRELGLDLS